MEAFRPQQSLLMVNCRYSSSSILQNKHALVRPVACPHHVSARRCGCNKLMLRSAYVTGVS